MSENFNVAPTDTQGSSSESTQWDTLSNMPMNSSSQTGEEEKKGFTPEDAKDVNKLGEQLEKMGVNPEIAQNSAFRRELKSIMQTYGLVRANDVSVAQFEDLGDTALGLQCTGERSDAWGHERSYLKFVVDQKGGLSITSAYADHENTRMSRDQFKNYNLQRTGYDTDEEVQVIRVENVAAVTKFSMTEDGQSINMVQEQVVEGQYTPLQTAYDWEKGIHTASKEKSSCFFDKNGVEQYREDFTYQPHYSDHLNTLVPELGLADQQSKMNKVKTRLESGFDRVDRSVTLSRNEDDTIKVYGYDASKGGIKIEIDRCPMNTQYGTDELIPSNGYISDAFREAEERGHR